MRVACLLALLLAVRASDARADEAHVEDARAAAAAPVYCRAIDGGSATLGHIDAQERMAWLDHQLARAARRTRIWTATWTTTFATVGMIQLARLPTAHGTSDRAAIVVSTTAPFIGVLASVFLPPKLNRDREWWDARRAHAPPGSDPCALLADLEALLVRDAASAEFGTGPLVHFGNFAINIAAGLTLGLGFGRWDVAAYTMFPGIVIGGIQAATLPTDAIDILRAYRAGDLTHGPFPTRNWSLTPTLSRDYAGLGFTLHF